MDRRQFVRTAAGSLLALPLIAGAQQPTQRLPGDEVVQ